MKTTKWCTYKVIHCSIACNSKGLAQPQCQSVGDSLNELQHIQVMKHRLPKKIRKLMCADVKEFLDAL